MDTVKENIPLLKVENFSVSFKMYDKNLHQYILPVVTNLNIEIYSGEILAIAGSSGSGKSILAHGIFGILPSNAICKGKIYYKGQEMTAKLQEEIRGREISLMPQSVTYLDPLMKIGKQIFKNEIDKDLISKQREVFERFGLKRDVEKMYPYQLSGGMARRVLASIAVLSESQLIIADEPTPGLGEEVSMEILKTFRDFTGENKGVIFITHDIDLALKVADRIAVFYEGTTVENALVSDFSGDGSKLCHSFSRALYRALPQNGFHCIDETL